MKNGRNIAIGAVVALLSATTVTGLLGWHHERQRSADLEAQVAKLQVEDKRSAVARSVSKQMEDIAYQQKEISDEQREEALQQTRVANEMRQRSEIERMKALSAQDKALASERVAQEARQVAERQQQIAEHQRIQAELSKRLADTLSYRALGRSLGSLSSIQTQLGDTELGDKLAYASYIFSKRYGGDLYYPTVFQSLMTASQSKNSWAKHLGAIMGLEFMPGTDEDKIVTVSTYGEILLHEKKGEQLQTINLLSNNLYDFRDVFVDDNGAIYAVSRTGHLVIIDNNATRTLFVEGLVHPMGITNIDDNSILLVGECGMAVYDKQRKMIVATREMDFKFTSLSRYDNYPMLFDNQGHQHLVKDINELVTTDIPVKATVTAFASSKQSGKLAYGTSDGTIYLLEDRGHKVTKLSGHLSRISKLKIKNNQLYSSSYDGTMKLWNTSSEKIEPMTLLSTSSWIMNFTFNTSKQYAWIGDQNGNVIEALMSVPMMADIISKKMKSDFTAEEWNYYIGRDIPYEKFTSGSRKEVKP